MCSFNNTLVHQVDMSLARAPEMLADVLLVVSYMEYGRRLFCILVQSTVVEL